MRITLHGGALIKAKTAPVLTDRKRFCLFWQMFGIIRASFGVSPFLFRTLFSFIINLGPYRPVSVHSDQYNQSSAHVRPVIDKSKYNK